MEHVCYFRHALALDERRVKFLPEYAHGGVTYLDQTPSETSKPPHTKEVWFAGTHSDMYVNCGSGTQSVEANYTTSQWWEA